MILDRLPPSLQQHLLLEWLSPESVWILVRVSGVLRRCVVKDTAHAQISFQAANREVLSDACVRWFREQAVPLRLWTVVQWKYDGAVEEHLSNGKLHRDDDLPAVVGKSGRSRLWYQHGKRHRDGDKPAVVEEEFGCMEWYQHGKLHRDNDQPAYVRGSGTKCWYQHGIRHRDGDQPAIIWVDGTMTWAVHGKRHRDGDLPAEIHASGSQLWFQHNKLHRANGAPAIIGPNGSSKTWYHRGKLIRTEPSSPWWSWNRPKPNPF